MTANSVIEKRSHGRTPRVSVLLASLAALLFASVSPAAEIVGSARLIAEREGHTATLLGKGSVLVVGGRSSGGPIAVAEIYDPTTRTFSVAGTSLQARADHAAVRLADGRVLVLGGRGRDQALASTEIYDSKTNTFSAGPSLTHARFGHTATLLADGRVVVIGGDATGCAEIYEPSTGLLKDLEQCLSVPRRLHAAIVLRDGNVLVAGGIGSNGSPLASAEILNLETLSFSEAPIPMLTARASLTLRLLPDGKAQAIGGDDEATMELFNPAGGYFTALGHLGRDARVLAAALRNTGRTALIGSPASARPSLTRLSAEGTDLGTADVLDRSSYTVTELPGANLAILVGGLSSGGALQQRAVLFSSSSATVTTDKPDYAPGETVTITGTGWLPGETVTLNIHRDTNDPPDTVLTAVADANGNITNDEYVCQDFDLGVTFLLTATGQTSGYTAQTTFTDARNLLLTFAGTGSGTVTVTPSTGTVEAPVACGGTGAPALSQTVFTTCLPNITTSTNGAIVTFTAAAGIGSTFGGWSGATNVSSSTCTGTTNPCSAVLGANPTLTVTFNAAANAAPVAATPVVSPEPSNEGSAVNVSATFTDADTTQAHTCSVNWGDGSPLQAGTVTEAAGSGTCNAGPHTYVDDNPTGTASDSYTVNVTVTDNGTPNLSGSNTTSHAVNNVAPVINNGDFTVSPGTIAENGSTTLSGTFTDPGTADTHTVTIAWGDGSANTVLNLGAGMTSFGPTAHTYLDDNPTGTVSDAYTITVTVTDDDTGSDSATASVTVNNVAPVVATPTTNSPTVEGSSATVSASFTDVGTLDTHTCTINWGDGSPVAPGTVAAGACTGSHTYADEGTGSYTVTATVTDDDTGSHSNSVSHTVTNAPPVIGTVTVSPEPSFEGQSVTASATYTDAGTLDTHTCTVDYGDGSGPLAGTAAGGTCTGPAHTYADEGTGSYTVTVVVSDNDGDSDTETATHAVQNAPPVVGPVTVAPSPSTEGQSVTASATYTDAGTLDTHTCTVDYGDGSGPLPGTAAGGTCTGPAHAYADEGTGSYTVTVSVSDNDGGNDSNSTSHTVSNVNPTVNTPTVAPPTSTEGGSVTASATFSDPGTLDTHSCTVDYGDGTGAQAGTVVGTTCTGPAHTWADNGTFTITVTVTDNDGGPGSNTTSHVVGNADPIVGAVTTSTPTAEGSLATASASFTDAGTADTHTCSINWGDGNTTTGTVTQGAGSGSCSGSHTYGDNSSYTVTVTITDDDGGSGSNTATHVVTNVAPSVGTVSVTPEPSAEGSVANLSAGFTDPGTGDTHTCTINWGDGSAVQAGTVSSGTCTGSHTYGDNGSYTVAVTVTDDDGDSGTRSTTHVVFNVAPTVGTVAVSPEPSAEGGAVTASATFTDPGTNDAPFTCTVNYGDGSGVLAGTVTVNTCNGPSHVYADNGSYTVTIAVTDKNGDTGSNSGSHVVGNANPVITAIAGPTDPIQIGGSASVTATFTDAGTADTHTCSINWGDGATTSGTVAETNGSGTCSGSHTYGAVGVYQVTVTVTDDDGGSDTEVYAEYVVIFDPNGGFVTGGGWINSPPGAYPANPDAVGKANFGFVSKYKKGAGAALEGETEFQFKAGDLNFHSTSYEWMVISGAKARYRGVGTINGSGSYAFELTAWDGQASGGGGTDKFRIRIYGVYDNQLGAPDGADPTTALGGGSIVIHKPK